MVAHGRDDGLGSGSNGGERANGSEKNRKISEANSSDNKQPSPVWVFVVFFGDRGCQCRYKKFIHLHFP